MPCATEDSRLARLTIRQCRVPAITTPRVARHAMTDPRDRPDSSDSTLPKEPTDRTDANDPTDPIDSAEPTYPIDSTESVDAIDSSERRER